MFKKGVVVVIIIGMLAFLVYAAPPYASSRMGWLCVDFNLNDNYLRVLNNQEQCSMKLPIQQHKVVLGKIILFVLIVFALVPWISNQFIADQMFTLNFFSLPGFILIMTLMFGIYNRDIILKQESFPRAPTILVFSILSLISFALYIAVRHTFQDSVGNFILSLFLSGTIYFIATVFVTIAIFDSSLFKCRYRSLLLFLVIGYCFIIFNHILREFGNFLGRITGRLTYGILSLVYPSAFLQSSSNNLSLGIQSFSVTIGEACSGIEGISVFIGLFLLFVAYEGPTLNWKRSALMFGLGLCGVFLLNVLRITSLMIIGTKSQKFALGLFHSQAGWLFFSVFVLLLINFSYRWIKKKEI